MNYYEISPGKASGANVSTLTYESKDSLEPGQLVAIDVRSRKLPGVVISEVNKPKYKTKPITEKLDLPALPTETLELATWLSDYYLTSLPAVWQMILPSGLLTKRRGEFKSKAVHASVKLPKLNTDQLAVVERFTKSDATTHLLQGVTGSGKTRVYIELIKAQLSDDKSALVLVPEIALTTQLVETIQSSIPDYEVVVTHSNISAPQRHLLWQKVIANDQPLVVIGPRSALFMPLQNIGLIVLDEAHEGSYKQESAPRYNTAHVAAKLASLHKSKVLLGTATPHVADRYTLEAKGGEILRLDKPAVQQQKNRTTIVDMREKKNFSQSSIISSLLQEELELTLKAGRQSVLLINRRGSASNITCSECGWVADCPRCQMPLTFHRDVSQYRCHICGFKDAIKTSCPVCKATEIRYLGYGTKQVEAEARKLFPEANVARLDRDSLKKDYHSEVYEKLKAGEIDILVGTQMIAKGLDLPKVDTIGVVLADSTLYIPDYTASERTFQLIHQVAGRAGRHDHPGHVLIQSYNPDSPIIQLAAVGDYDKFYTSEIDERKSLGYPPFRFLLKIECRCASGQKAASDLLRFAQKHTSKGVSALGPAPSWHEHVGGKHQWQLILRSHSRSKLVDIARQAPDVWTIDLDPASLL